MSFGLLTKEDIEQYLTELDLALQQIDAKGEICLYGGAVMCVVYEARPATKDIDAVFRPTREIRNAVAQIAQAHDLPDEVFKILESYYPCQIIKPATQYFVEELFEANDAA